MEKDTKIRTLKAKILKLEQDIKNKQQRLKERKHPTFD